MRKIKAVKKKLGMSMVELLVSITIFGFVSVGASSSAILFAKIASNHEHKSDFRKDMRLGFEQMSFDVRNANGVSNRTDSKFTLTFANSPNVQYWYDADTEIIYRQETGNSREIMMRNISTFDILTSAADVGSNTVLSFDDDEISLETITFRTGNGSGPESEMSMKNLTLKLRSS